LFLFSCIRFKEHPLDPTTPRGYFLSSFLRNHSIDQDNNSIDQDNNSIDQDNSSIYQEAKGILDDSFGNGSGYVTQSILSYDYGYSLAIQDGKILLGGYCNNGSYGDFCIARFKSDGTLDKTFGSSGIVIQPIGSYSDYGYSLAIQDGKILLGGHCFNVNNSSWDFCIARFNSDGNLDTSDFGYPNGYITKDIGLPYNYGKSLAIQDGKILLGGYCSYGGNDDFCIARFNSDGSLDTSFGTNGSGYIIRSIGSSDDFGRSLVIQKNGNILLGGTCNNGSNDDFCIARFKSDGSSLDETFGTNGSGYKTISITSGHDYGNSLAIQSDGKILLGGYCSYGGNDDFCIARFNSDGTLDTSFGTSGIVKQAIGSSHDRGQSLAIQPNGKILLGGSCSDGTDYDFCIARFNSDGTLDTSFGSSGKLTQRIGSFNDFGRSLVIQPDGNILLGGYCDIGGNNDFCIARFK